MRWFRKRWKSDRRGVAAVEFALMGPVLLIFLGGIFDLGHAMWAQSCLANAVAQGAEYAYRKQQTGISLTASQIRSFVQTVSAVAGVDATSTTAPGYYCMDTSVSPPVLHAAVQNDPCTAYDGIKAGYYVNIIATYTFTPVLPHFIQISNNVITERTWARLM